MVNVMDGTNVFQEGSLLKLSLVFVDLGEDGLPRLDVDGDISFHVSQIGKQAHCHLNYMYLLD